ncbi:alpha-1,2-fucosyltransferase [Flavitalea sp.]|nr:alpha-1,2-fucosyltransferase [Flavitalea sp.]
MIAVQLAGGLGNQLFQYAMGRSIATRNRTELKLDITFFENYEWHEYSLEPFSIDAPIAGKVELDRLKKRQESFVERFKRKYLGGHPIVVQEKNLLFDAAYLAIKSPGYLFGYWQCEKYFSEFESLVRKELQIKIDPSPPNLALLNEIKSKEAISLHIRRGNFVTVDFVNKAHGTCSMDYYQAAIQLTAEKCKNPEYYIFSDDIPWVKQNLQINYPHVFVDINDAKTDYEDLRLMYSCKHHIIANSTFSWWGAWLNKSKDKLVIAPERWFADEVRNEEAKDIIPKEWRRL